MAYTELIKDGGVAFIWLDQPGEKVNKLSLDLADEFRTLFDSIEADSETKAVVLISRKPDTFIAGADLERLLELQNPGEVEALSRKGQALLQRIADFPKPVVAAIHGAALGGGLEVALACHARIASDSSKTILGLPEVKLGLLPAAGGTQRLPRLLGLPTALNMMLTGRNIFARPARKMGLVDALIHPYGLASAARKMALDMAAGKPPRRRRPPLLQRILGRSPARKLVFRKSRQMVSRQTFGNYPAPFKIIEAVETGLEKGLESGLAAESRFFEILARSEQAKELIQLFFAMNSRKKNPAAEKARPVNGLAVLGAGFMGAGIAAVSASRGMTVLLKDISREALARGEKVIWEEFNRKVKKRALSAFQRDQIFSRVSGITDYSSLRKCPLVIEAVFEDLDLKQKVLGEVEQHVAEDCVFASNTSSLPISKISRNARHPSRVLGMHYFSPVSKMPLLEIIATPRTEEWVVATAVEVGIRQGKTVIVVNDGPGFYTTRILAPMLNEALLLIQEGGEIRHIDRTMKQFGFPVGPLTLIDEVGIDVGAHVAEVLEELFAARGVQGVDTMKRLQDAGFLGRKNRQGFYHYPSTDGGKRRFGGKKKEENQTIYRFFGEAPRRKLDEAEIQNRLSLVMVNEAAYCLQDGILNRPEDGDLGAVLGLGFPPFLGGPFRYIDRLSAPVVLSMLGDLEKRFGKRFTPAQIIHDQAAAGKKFYPA